MGQQIPIPGTDESLDTGDPVESVMTVMGLIVGAAVLLAAFAFGDNIKDFVMGLFGLESDGSVSAKVTFGGE